MSRACLLVSILCAHACERTEPVAAPTSAPAPAIPAPKPQSTPVEEMDVDELPPGLRELAIQSSRDQAKAGEGARATVHAAWTYAPPPALDDPEQAKLVAVDMQLDIPGSGFDLDDIDIFDADLDENYGSSPMLQRLTLGGEPVAFDDPDVASDEHAFRMLAVWSVPRSVHRIKLGYWTMPLSDAVTIVDRGDGPRVIDETPVVVGYSVGEPAGASQVHYVWIECECSRVAKPPSFQLVSGDELLSAQRSLQVDRDGKPMRTPISARPYYGTLRWVLEYRSPAGIEITDINRYGERTPLASLASPQPSAGLREALGRVPLRGDD